MGCAGSSGARVTDSRPGGGGDRPEIGELLSGLDPPRSLPGALRQRLEDALTAEVAGDGPGDGPPARPLEPELNERLTAALESREDQDMAMLLSGLDAARPLPAALSARLRVRFTDEAAPSRGRLAILARVTRTQIGAGVAAACLLVAAVTGIALTGHHTSRPAAGSSSTAGAQSARLPSAASGGGTGSGAGGVTGGATTGAGQTSNQAQNATGLVSPESGQAAGGSAAGSSASSGSPGSYNAANPAPASAPASTQAPNPAPQVLAVVPASGSATGGTTVTIRGVNFDGATAVRFGTMAALNFVVMSNNQITAISPPHLPGFVNVTVTTAHGTSAVTKNDRYEYIP
jgi:hypothetical protein